MRIKILSFILSVIILSACNKDNAEPLLIENLDLTETSDSCTIVTKLIAGGGNYDNSCTGYEIGNITVIDDGSFITVIYNSTLEGWVFNETHLYVGPETDIPANKPGNPIPGQFPWNQMHEHGVTTYTIGPIDTPAGSYVVAAHASVQKEIAITSTDSLCGLLPETVDFIFKAKGPVSYLDIEVLNGGWLNGNYQGWCVDVQHGIVIGTYYPDADVYCTYDPLPDGLVDHPENIDLINWILNNVSTGQPSACGDNYTYGDIQRAVWDLIDDDNTDIGLEEWSQCRADEIVANATANGEGYIPECGGYVGTILDAGENIQTIIIAVPFTCSGSQYETAWGYGQYGEYCDTDGAEGTSFTDSEYYGGNRWGWYFYGCQ